MNSRNSVSADDDRERQLRYAALPFPMNRYRRSRQMRDSTGNVSPMSQDDSVTYVPDRSLI